MTYVTYAHRSSDGRRDACKTVGGFILREEDDKENDEEHQDQEHLDDQRAV